MRDHALFRGILPARLIHMGRHLQWKLTFSALLTTVVTVLLIELLTLLLIVFYFFSSPTQLWQSNLQSLAQQATPFFVHEQPDQAELTRWLHLTTTDAYLRSPNSFLAVVDRTGHVLVSEGGMAHPHLSALEQQQLTELLQGKAQKAARQDEGPISVLMAPIRDGAQTKGAMVLRSDQLITALLSANVSNLLPLIVLNLAVITLLTICTGMISGFLTARSFTRRFKRLSVAVATWSQGDFSGLAYDSSADELGQLVRQLNRMAEQLQEFLRTRQQLATLEERNRLARDLHDSVKQQVFVLAMQVGAARVLLGRDMAAAQQCLHELDQLIRQVQLELTSLIQELRPVALSGKQLSQALEEYVQQWRKQTWIAATFAVKGSCTLSPSLEEALFRITQEALSNVARHSNATQVQLQLHCTEESVTLAITDDGKGFEPQQLNGHGVGLLSMRERIQELGGEIQIDSTVGEGTHIRIQCQNVPSTREK